MKAVLNRYFFIAVFAYFVLINVFFLDVIGHPAADGAGHEIALPSDTWSFACQLLKLNVYGLAPLLFFLAIFVLLRDRDDESL